MKSYDVIPFLKNLNLPAPSKCIHKDSALGSESLHLNSLINMIHIRIYRQVKKRTGVKTNSSEMELWMSC